LIVETKRNKLEMNIPNPSDIPVVSGAVNFVNDGTHNYLKHQKEVYGGLPKEGKSLIKVITISLTTIIILLLFSFLLYFMHTKYITNNQNIVKTQKEISEDLSDVKIEQKKMGDTLYVMNARVASMQSTLKSIDNKLK